MQQRVHGKAEKPHLRRHCLNLERPHPHRLLQPHAHAHGPLADVPALRHARQHQPAARVVVAGEQPVLCSVYAARSKAAKQQKYASAG